MLRTTILGLWLVLSGTAQAETFAGTVRVVDGDTLDVGGTRVRLYGIDAPEIGQPCTADGESWDCGRWAQRRVRALYQGKRSTCDRVTTDVYGRVVARCRVGGQDIGAHLVAEGIAEAFRRYALDYVDEEKSAFVAARGIWRGEMQSPSDYRASSAAPGSIAPGACVIKGNISGSGRIYHMPGQRHYHNTRISPAKGERWFCSESDAVAAGWRRSRR
ncbi:MAG: thermonuclease family protein [Rhodobacteraceae bacterium]|nr:thermonuclease family protein [Paracoccaceae bacterium]